MIPTAQLSVFILASSILIATPGPNFLYVLTRGITQGKRAALVAVVGLGCGVVLHTSFATLGLSALLAASSVTFQIVKYAGAAYLILVGFQTLHRKEFSITAVKERVARNQVILRQSILSSITNPKTILFFLSFLPQFTNRAAAIIPQFLLLGFIYMFLTLAIYGLLAVSSGTIGELLRRNARNITILRWCKGLSFIGLGVWAAFPNGAHN
jgi:threonine/homoserine/homoserine lactone efflux protein